MYIGSPKVLVQRCSQCCYRYIKTPLSRAHSIKQLGTKLQLTQALLITNLILGICFPVRKSNKVYFNINRLLLVKFQCIVNIKLHLCQNLDVHVPVTGFLLYVLKKQTQKLHLFIRHLDSLNWVFVKKM